MLKINQRTLSSLRTLPWLVLGVIVIGSFPALADSAPLTLTNQDVGLTAAEIEASQAPSNTATEPALSPAAAATTPTSQAAQLRTAADAAQLQAQAAAREAKVATAAAEAAAAGQIPGIGKNQDGPPRYETCVEASIRRGLSLNGSDRLCRAIFPKATDGSKPAPGDPAPSS